MSLKNTDFLRFNAYSIKELITRKLAEDSTFTDQVYEGSNLVILIDLVSYMFQCLMYHLNNAAAESMFSDTQLYENMSRLCKFIGYNPKGITGTTVDVMLEYANESQYYAEVKILPFSMIETNLVDERGSKICFSTNSTEDRTDQSKTKRLHMLNGRWKLYPTVFTASGIDNETFELSEIKSSSDDNKYVSIENIRVFIDSVVAETESSYSGSKTVDDWKLDKNELFVGLDQQSTETASFSKLYDWNEKRFSIRLNENKNVELKFGNDVICKKLNEGDKVYVFYLDTNGPDGYIDLNEVSLDKAKLRHNPSMFNLSRTMYNKIFNIDDNETLQDVDYSLKFVVDTLSKFKEEETVEEIRQNAPNWFKTGNRLITREDYEYYISNRFQGVIDIKCMNNWEYLATFYKWLYYWGINPNPLIINRTIKNKGGKTYIDQYRLESEMYKYVDAADACNLYLWIKNDISNVESLNEKLKDFDEIKTLTTEVYALNPIHVLFDICSSPENVELSCIRNETNNSNDTYIEVTLEDNSIYVAQTIQLLVANIINDYFQADNCKLGQLVKFDDILNEIYAINGVIQVRTIYKSASSDESTKIIDGLSFASYSGTLLELGEDLQISNNSRKLEEFQFPTLKTIKQELLEKIVVIKKTLTNVSPIKF